MKNRSLFASAAVLAGVAGLAQAQLIENFDNVPGLAAGGWHLQNNSVPVQATYFQGNTAVFPPQASAGYIAANFQNTSAVNTISNWLLTPQILLENQKQLRFWTRTTDTLVYPDRLQVRQSLAGASTNVGTAVEDVGDFGTLLLDINPTLSPTGYPNVWTEYVVTISGLGAPTQGRLAFRYYVTDSGPAGLNGDYIGIDEVTYGVSFANGACCLPNGTCPAPMTQPACQAQGGVYQGDNQPCPPAGCPQPGACCFVDGSCISVQPAACTAAGGTFGGAGSACASCPQPTCYELTGQAVAIADPAVGGTAGPDANAVLNVAAGGTISTLLAKIRVPHTWQGDVRVQLIHPDLTALDLVTRPGVAPPKLTNTAFGFGNDNYGNTGTNTWMSFGDAASSVYDDAIGFPGPPAGSATIQDNVTGLFKAHGGSLNSTFGGKPLAGAWTFRANDYAPPDQGIIEAVAICVPAAVTAVCYPNCDGSTILPCLNVQDFGCFLNSFGNSETYANCDLSTIAPVLNVQDFGCFLNKFGSSCSSC